MQTTHHIERQTDPGPRFVAKVITATMIVFGTAIVLMLLWTGRHVLLLLFAGLLLSVLLRLPANALARRTGLSDRWTVSIVLLVLAVLLTAAGWATGPRITEQLGTFQQELVRSFGDLRGYLEQSRVGSWLLDNLPGSDDVDMQQMWQRAAGVWATVFGALGSAILVLAVGLFFAYHPSLYVRGMLRLVPLHRRHRACEVAGAVSHDLRMWLLSQLVSMLVLWAGTWLALGLIGVPMAFMLAVLAGLLTFVPYLGPLIAFVPIALVAFTDSVQTGVLASVAYFIVQIIEGNFVMPLIYQRMIKIPPAVTLASQLLFGSIAGLLGVALATPLVAVTIVLVRSLYVEDALGDSMDQPALPPPQAEGCVPAAPDSS